MYLEKSQVHGGINYLLVFSLIGALAITLLPSDTQKASSVNKKNIFIILILSLLTAVLFLFISFDKKKYCDYDYTHTLNDYELNKEFHNSPFIIKLMKSSVKEYDKKPFFIENINIANKEDIEKLKKALSDWLKSNNIDYKDIIISYENVRLGDEYREIRIQILSGDKKLVTHDPYFQGVLDNGKIIANFSMSAQINNCK